MPIAKGATHQALRLLSPGQGERWHAKRDGEGVLARFPRDTTPTPAHTRSIASAMPWPPPMHIVIRPNVPPVRCR